MLGGVSDSASGELLRLLPRFLGMATAAPPPTPCFRGGGGYAAASGVGSPSARRECAP